nr:TIGR02281 family clan AA aspartic protease [Pseudomonas luteola]
MSHQTAGQRAGRVMLFLAWGAGLWLLAHWFGGLEVQRQNPNQVPVSQHGDGYIEVSLAGNGAGHFLANGSLNGKDVTFVVDTGATDVALSAELSATLKLPHGGPVLLSTANGRAEGWRTRINELRLGDIVLHDVRALVAPNIDGDQVLLGMSALRQLEFTQRGGTLLLRQYTKQE